MAPRSPSRSMNALSRGAVLSLCRTVTGEPGVGDEEDKSDSDDDQEIASTESHHDSEQWKELEEVEGNVSDLIATVSPEAAAFWATAFKEVPIFTF